MVVRNKTALTFRTQRCHMQNRHGVCEAMPQLPPVFTRSYFSRSSLWNPPSLVATVSSLFQSHLSPRSLTLSESLGLPRVDASTPDTVSMYASTRHFFRPPVKHTNRHSDRTQENQIQTAAGDTARRQTEMWTHPNGGYNTNTNNPTSVCLLHRGGGQRCCCLEVG